MRFILFGILGLAGAGLGAAEPVFPAHRHFEPSPPVRHWAAEAGVPLIGGGDSAPRAAIVPGDRCVVLVTLTQGDDREQWLIDFRARALTAEEQQRAAESAGPGMTLHSSTGRELVFGQEPVGMAVTIAGPMDATASRPEREAKRAERKSVDLVVNGQFLALGLDRLADAVIRLRGEDGRVGFGVRSGEPFPEAEAQSNRERLEGRGVTAADERAMAGAVPAVMEFFGIAARTPGLRGILLKVIDIPWWSLVRNLGQVSSSIDLHSAGVRAAQGEGRFIVPLTVTINEKPALVSELVVERPVPPRTLLAGITAIHAGQPDGRGPLLTIELLATPAGPGSEHETGL